MTTSGLSIPRIAAFFYYFPSRTNDKVSSTAASNNTVTFSGPESGFLLCHGQEQHQHKTIATSSFILFFCFAGKTHKVLLHVVLKIKLLLFSQILPSFLLFRPRARAGWLLSAVPESSSTAAAAAGLSGCVCVCVSYITTLSYMPGFTVLLLFLLLLLPQGSCFLLLSPSLWFCYQFRDFFLFASWSLASCSSSCCTCSPCSAA